MKLLKIGLRGLVLGLLLPGLSACGTEDSDPPVFSEARFEVIPQGGETVFEVVNLAGGSVTHEFPEGATFTSSATFNFLVENAPPPHSGTFRRVSGAEIRVCLSVGEQVFVMCANTDAGTPSVVVRAGPEDGDAEPQAANPDVRFNVCAPEVGESQCAVTGDIGRFLDFTGTVGDLGVTHLIRRATNESSLLKTPAVVFLQGADDEVNGVFLAAESQLLQVELLVNGIVADRGVDTGDVIVREDL